MSYWKRCDRLGKKIFKFLVVVNIVIPNKNKTLFLLKLSYSKKTLSQPKLKQLYLNNYGELTVNKI